MAGAGVAPSSLGRVQAAVQAALDDKNLCLAKYGDNKGADATISSTIAALRSEVAHFVSAAQQQPLTQADVEVLWRMCCELWNTCVEATNSGAVARSQRVAVDVAWLRHLVCELVALAADAHVSEEEHVARLRWCTRAAKAWTDLGALEQAEAMLSIAGRHSSAFEALLQEPTTPGTKRERYLVLLLGVYSQRLENAWKLQQRVLASQMLGLAHAAALELGQPGPCLNLVRTLHSCATAGLAAQEASSAAVGLLTAAYELVGHVKGMAGEGEPLQDVQEMEQKVLLGLACCHIMAADTASGSPSDLTHGLQAIKQLRLLDDSATGPGSHPAVALLALKALLAEGRWEEAEAEGMGIVVHDGADEGACCTVLEALATAQGVHVTSLRAVVELAQSRFPNSGTILTSFITAALSPNTTQQRAVAEEVEGLALETLARSSEAKQAVMSDVQLRQQVCTALFNHALACFEGKRFEACVGFCSAVMDFAEADIKGRAARMAALCHIGTSQLPAALEATQLSDKCQPAMVGASFIRFKALLEMGDVERVKDELTHMVACIDFDKDLLKVACQEALTSDALPVAKAALLQLHTMLAAAADKARAAKDSCNKNAASNGPADKANGSRPATPAAGLPFAGSAPMETSGPGAVGKDDTSDAAPDAAVAAGIPGKQLQTSAAATTANAATTPEALVLRTLIMCIMKEAAQFQQQAQPPQQHGLQGVQKQQQDEQGGAHGEGQGDLDATEGLSEAFRELADVFELVAVRVGVLGLEGFMGKAEGKVQQHLEWFAAAAWNAALHASDTHAYQSCAVLMHACSQLLMHHPHPTPATTRQLKLTHLLAASAALETHKQHPEDSASLRWAAKVLEDGRAAAAAMAAGLPGSSAVGSGAPAGAGAGAGGGTAAPAGMASAGVAGPALAGAAVLGSDAAAGSDAAGVAANTAGLTGTGKGGAAAAAATGNAVRALMHGASAASGGDLSDVCACLTAFSIGARLRDRALQAAALERAEGLAALTVEHALKLVAVCNGDDQYRDLDIAFAAHKLAIKKLLAGAEPDYGALAVVVREAVQGAPSEDQRLGVIREAKELLDTLPASAWPAAERQWLLATTWNKGLHHLRFQRPAQAAQHMELALGLLRQCPQFEARRQMMSELLAEAAGRKSGGDVMQT